MSQAVVTSPPSRAQLNLPAQRAGELVSGKFFPASDDGLTDPTTPSDEPNRMPPADGHIASAGLPHALALDEAGKPWMQHAVKAGQELDITWEFPRPVKVRRFKYFLTRHSWAPHQPLSRAQFESTPFAERTNADQPYWTSDSLDSGEQVKDSLQLPDRHGYHVLLAVMEAADTPLAAYQVIDLQFS